MDSLEVKPVRGTNDFVPPDEAALRGLEQRLRAFFELYGYQGVATPIIEPLDLFLRKSGEDLLGRVYAFTHWNRRLCLRPELTASVIRAYVNHLQDRPLPVRLHYAGPSFRYEKPQRGRYRQFTETGVECIGAPGPLADAEMLHLACGALRSLGIADFRLVVGHLGVVLQFLAGLGIDERGQGLILAHMEDLARGRTSPDAIVDRLNALLGLTPSADSGDFERALPALLQQFGPDEAVRIASELLQRAHLSLEGGTRSAEEIVQRLLVKAARPESTRAVRQAVDFIVHLRELAGPPQVALGAFRALVREHDLDPRPLEEVAATLELFEAYGSAPDDLVVDLTLGRGLRYYSGLVFEIYDDGPEGPLQLCGGGRYDELARALGARRDTPACGFSFGVERLRLALAQRGLLASESARPHVLVAPVEAADQKTAIQIGERLRAAGLRVELDLRARGPRGNLRHASRTGVPIVVIVGERERESETVLVRDMAAHEERLVPVDHLESAVVAALRASRGVA